MSKNLRKIVAKIILGSLSVLVSVCFLIISINVYLKISGQAKNPIAIAWMLDGTDFWPDITFWSKSWCKYSPENCKYPEEKLLSSPVQQYDASANTDSQKCVKILFLGDSFTIAPWVSAEESYSSIFSKRFSESKHLCVKSYRLATGGANNSQELLAFSQRVAKLKPDIVFWQFYWSDIPENSKEEVFTVTNGQLTHQMAWTNMLFLAGFLNQKVPLLKNTTLGKHLMYLGEQEDPFSFWSFDFRDTGKTIQYNKELIPLLLNKMNEKSQSFGFVWYTTLAPLECQIVSDVKNCDSKILLQNELRQLLLDNSKFISMEDQQNYSPASMIRFQQTMEKNSGNQVFFNTTDDKTEEGGRHLSKEGNALVGKYLFENYVISQL